MRAFIYGGATVLEPLSAPLVLAIRDQNGNAVSYERIGRMYRLPWVLGDFTVWADGTPTTFTVATQTRAFGAPSSQVATRPSAAASSRPVPLAVAPPASDTQALHMLCELQLEELRSLFDAAEKSSMATGDELFAIDRRLQKMTDKLSSGEASIIRVSFPTSGARFEPDAAVADVLAASARRADVIKISGYTDSRLAGPLDPMIARRRAIAAERFLVDRGVDRKRIEISSHADGNFTAPNHMTAGRAANRRVEIELVNAPLASLAGATP
jgi:outer membrane protein OmpA-like peptidoglycan-associated protein